jgi:NADP-dependent 3-hydroxy acid dehydrogenase YdfG
VVAGASSGIGAETARALAEAGFPVALGARRVDRCEKIAAEIRSAGGEAVALPLDVSDEASVAEFAELVTKELGDAEVVISNAALIGPGALVDTEVARLQQELDVNVVGPHRLVRAFLPGMLARQRGDLVFVSSDVAIRPRPFMGGYSATKSALEGLVGALQMEIEGSGVRASIVRPGPTWSEMGMDWDADAAARVLTEWVKWGHARHSHFLKARAIADAITTVVSAPRGVHISPVDVNPEAPIGGGA